MNSSNYGQETLSTGRNKMQIAIDSIEKLSETQFAVTMRLGADSIIAHVTESNDPELKSFNFDEYFFDVLFAFEGLGGRFNRDYWAFRDGSHSQFPWNYGDYDPKIVERAIEESDTQLTSLK